MSCPLAVGASLGMQVVSSWNAPFPPIITPHETSTNGLQQSRLFDCWYWQPSSLAVAAMGVNRGPGALFAPQSDLPTGGLSLRQFWPSAVIQIEPPLHCRMNDGQKLCLSWATPGCYRSADRRSWKSDMNCRRSALRSVFEYSVAE
ncbi:hypothetical protein BJX62DRAFT_114280 [Aspergillus germanicus]